MPAVKIPYTMYCPNCKTGLKIKDEKMIGRDIHCPKCEKRIQVVTPDEDGHVPYGVIEEPLSEKGKRDWVAEKAKEEYIANAEKTAYDNKIKARWHWFWTGVWAAIFGAIVWLFVGYVIPKFQEQHEFEDHKTAKKQQKRAGDK